ncbi:MAG: SUMF1/EgtB/PvdO family nonheme iron enzyme [Verrucomicrobiales bacterium]|nr:SUMF1/EgtB/PvdO family nonheme iron enzyme [Verrucomicrobiales bacterium]
MKLSSFALFWIAGSLALPAVAAPVVSNLTAAQRTGTKLVDITYDVAAPGFPTVAVSLEISSDAGANWTVPATSATGHIGAGVAPGTGKAIVWDAGADWAGNYSTQMRFRVVADDGVTAVPGFAYIPGGSFTMGRTSGDSDSDAPPITVTVSAFYLAETETTKALWDEVRSWALNNGYTGLAAGAGKGADHPVQTVSWFDVVKWCNARSEKEGLTPVYLVSGNVMRTGTSVPTANWSANGYRLPTEAEWEKAARGGISGKRFPWGTDTISHNEANFRNDGGESYQTGTTGDHPSFATGGRPNTSPAGSFAANGYGLKGMAGNVHEWCWDWRNAEYYSDGANDPRGPGAGDGTRIRRGGSWESTANHCRAARRGGLSPGSAFDGTGFRSARSHIVSGMSLIPAGSFVMGRTSGDTDSNAPPITVTVSPFYLAETETTKALWDEVRTWAVSNGYSDLAAGVGKAASHPVQTVSWWDVVKWCNARSEMDGLTPVYTVGGNVMRTGTTAPEVNWSANGYRLPTEAEWEKAARGGVSGKRFPSGSDTISHTEANYYGSTSYAYDLSPINNYHPTYATGGFPYTSPVGSFAGNTYGLKEMAGNVLEWCWDWYGETYYTTGFTDPRGPATGSFRVFRGGGWNGEAIYSRASLRDFDSPSGATYYLGFRSARSSVP